MEMRAAVGPLLPAEPKTAANRQAAPAGDARPWLEALGGSGNVRESGAAAGRLWLRLADAGRINEALLAKLGVRMIARPEADTVHLLLNDAEPVAAALQNA
jgi:PTS system N-acetylglucosamine-specific IIC component